MRPIGAPAPLGRSDGGLHLTGRNDAGAQNITLRGISGRLKVPPTAEKTWPRSRPRHHLRFYMEKFGTRASRAREPRGTVK